MLLFFIFFILQIAIVDKKDSINGLFQHLAHFKRFYATFITFRNEKLTNELNELFLK